jgi:parallel beta-helix repeat protein
MIRRLLRGLAAALVCCAPLYALAQTITVNTAFDPPMDACDDRVLCGGNGNGIEGDVGDLPGRDGVITFREAIHAANVTGGVQNITFSTPANTITILRQGPLPHFRDSGATITGRKHTFKGNAISASGGLVHGLVVAGNDITIEGLVFNQFPNVFPGTAGSVGTASAGIVLLGNGNTVRDCVSGTDAGGAVSVANGIGIAVFGAGNTIGPRNVFSGNTWYGVGLIGNGNRVFENTIGSTPLPRVIGNGHSGVAIWGQNNVVGPQFFFRLGPFFITFGNGNEIVGNGGGGTGGAVYSGVTIMGGVRNSVVANRIGVDPAAAAAQGNRGSGVSMQSASRFNTILGNTISGNGRQGVSVNASDDNTVDRNRIGTNARGAARIPNEHNGIYIGARSSRNKVLDNVISGNRLVGVVVQQSALNEISGNRIGTDDAGGAPLPNERAGIVMFDAAADNLAGPAPAPGGALGFLIYLRRPGMNIISANGQSGVFLYGSGTERNRIEQNRIGTDRAGGVDLGNVFSGVTIEDGAKDNRILDNLISGNDQQGVEIRGAGTDENRVERNLIGLKLAGDAELRNGGAGVYIHTDAAKNYIGYLGVDSGNWISGHDHNGIQIVHAEHNQIHGNIIGMDKAGGRAIANTSSGIWLRDNANRTEIGTAAAYTRNYVSGNGNNGVRITDSNGVKIFTAYIGTDKNGRAPVKNAGHGVDIEGASSDTEVGEVAMGNVISGNGGAGVRATGSGVVGTRVMANRIGVDEAGGTSLANVDGVYVADTLSTRIGEGGRRMNVISGNTGFGVRITLGAQNATVAGNHVGLDAGGGAAIANGLSGIYVGDGSRRITIGGGAGDGNWIAGNTQEGIIIAGQGGTETVGIFGNTIGLDRRNVARPNRGGVLVDSGARRIVIGAAGGRGNTISGNAQTGVTVRHNGTSGVDVHANLIGTDAAGAPRPNLTGVSIEDGATRVRVGGLGAGEANTIAFNAGNGVQVLGNPTDRNPIRGNRIFENGGLGIDLDGNGVDRPDAGDADAGPNEQMNAPSMCIGVDRTTGRVYLAGQLLHPAAGTADIDFYANTALDPTGIGEGRTYLGTMRANAAGRFGVRDITRAPLGVAPGTFITATATDANGNTSEFSTAIAIAFRSTARLVTDKVGNPDFNHWVVPRNLTVPGPAVDFDFTPTPDTAEIRARLGWRNATVDPANQLHASVSGDAPAEHQVQITVDGAPCYEDRAWVVWADVAGTITAAPAAVAGRVTPPAAGGPPGPGGAMRTSWTFAATIQPASLITARDRPDFNMPPVTPVPNFSAPHVGDGSMLGQPLLKWDISRQVRVRILSPTIGTNDLAGGGGTLYVGLPAANRIVPATPSAAADSYPAADLEGNDDSGPLREDNDPYTAPNVGQLTDSDRPTQPVVLNRAGRVGDLIEVRAHFRAFVRLEITGIWFRVSDYFPWRFHASMGKVYAPGDDAALMGGNGNGVQDPSEGHWEDNHSVSDATNNGW